MLLFDEGRNEFDGLLGFFIFTFLFVNIRDCKWKVKLNNINVADLLVAFRQWFLIIFNDWFIAHLIYYTEIANVFFLYIIFQVYNSVLMVIFLHHHYHFLWNTNYFWWPSQPIPFHVLAPLNARSHTHSLTLTQVWLSNSCFWCDH